MVQKSEEYTLLFEEKFTPLILILFYIAAKKICFEKYGCFANTKYFKTKHAELPSHPHIIQTKFYLHTTFNRQSGELNINNISSIASSQFNSSHKTFIIIHGYDHHPRKPWVIKMKNELLINYQCNVIIVDWNKGASYRKLSYLKASRLLMIDCDYMLLLCRFFEKLLPIKKLKKHWLTPFGTKQNYFFIEFINSFFHP